LINGDGQRRKEEEGNLRPLIRRPLIDCCRLDSSCDAREASTAARQGGT
jgi:hypothetical protein